MKSRKLISVLIPVYNRKELITETIVNALQQSYENIEIIVVDNCSTDGTYEHVVDFITCANLSKKVKVFQNDRNIGPVLNWRKCLEYSCGEYVKILFSDDKIEANFWK